MKETLIKGALPFLLGVVVTLGVSALISPCCKDVLEQQQKEIVDTKKMVQGLQKDVVKHKRAINKLLNELIPAAPKPAAPVKATAPAKGNAAQPVVKK